MDTEALTLTQISARLGLQRRQVQNLAAKRQWPRKRFFAKMMVYLVPKVELFDHGDNRRYSRRLEKSVVARIEKSASERQERSDEADAAQPSRPITK
ncbi:hypothetical protein B0E45_14610 [Sinorhizobium sp. A49]|nr:hypothetical protein B0E45_14610 [Sinorhizobium sp. A49]